MYDAVTDVTEDGCRVLIRQVRRMRGITDKTSACKVRITRVTSRYVAGIETPVAKDYDDKLGMLKVARTSIRQLQRMISGRRFYGTKILRQDSVVLQGNKSITSRLHLWVGKLLMMLRIPRMNMRHGTVEQENDTSLEEYVFVQYYELQPLQDAIDNFPGCVRL